MRLARTGWKSVVFILVLALVGACQPQDSTTETPSTTATTTSVADTIPVTTQPQPPDPGRSYGVALQSDIVSDNYWSCPSEVTTELVLGPTRVSLYRVAMPGVNLIPVLAEPTQLPRPHPEGEVWVVDVPLRRDAVWSDGHPITAGDVSFTYNTAGEHMPGYCAEGEYGAVEPGSERTGVLAVEPVDEHTVRITFNDDPGLGVWPHTIGTAPILARHFWAPHLATAETIGRDALSDITDAAAAVWEVQKEAAETGGEEFTKTVEDISQEEIDAYMTGLYETTVNDTLHSVPGVGEPSGGPMVFAEWNPKLSIRNVANPRYFLAGEVIRSGDVTYTMGPFIEEQVFVIYGSEEEKVLALSNGEVDHANIPSALPPAFRALLDSQPDIARVENEMNGFWYLGFNLRKPLMSDLAFRRALSVMIDREFLANELIQGGVRPAWTLLPEGNRQYFDAAAAEEIVAQYRGMDRFQRLEKAVGILKEAGYTWDREPAVRRDEAGRRFIEAGLGIRMPNGSLVPELEVVSLGGDFYALMAVYNRWIERWLHDLGFPARTHITDFSGIVGSVWPGVGEEPTFDVYLLGWDLGTQAFPTYHESLFHSRNLAELNDGNNSTGYVNPELEQLTDQLNRVKTPSEAKPILWQLEAIIDRDLPYIVLNRLIFVDAYRTRVDFPFTETLGGIGDPGLVQIQE